MTASSNPSAKDARRRALKEARSALTCEQRSTIDDGIAANVMSLDEYDQADLLLPYLSVGAEVDTRAIIRDAWSRGKTVALPRCVPNSRTMRWYRVDSFDNLQTSPFGIDEPVDDPASEVDPKTAQRALALVPGFEFDRHGQRLGYGGGFYDVFLASFAGASAGLCRSQFLSDEALPHDAHDLPVDIVVCQDQVIRTK